MAAQTKDVGAIGFIGIGNMGWPQAANLARAGRQVVAFDADPSRAERFAAENGTRWAKSLAELGAAVDVVVTMLPTGQIVRSVMIEMEGGGLARSLRPGALLIDMSSSDPIGTRELGEALAKYRIAVVDAPVSGGTRGAKEGTLTIMIGGDDKAAIARAKPILETMGKRLFDTGPLGSGHAMKALNNYVAATGFAAASEALIVGERFGLDPKVMVDIMNVSTGRNFSTENTIKGQVLTRSLRRASRSASWPKTSRSRPISRPASTSTRRSYGSPAAGCSKPRARSAATRTTPSPSRSGRSTCPRRAARRDAAWISSTVASGQSVNASPRYRGRSLPCGFPAHAFCQ